MSCETELREAHRAYHLLMTGTAAVEVRDSNGETIKYNLANASNLLTYISRLETGGSAQLRPSGPMRVFM